MPRSEKQKAPMSSMNGPIVGTATAVTTGKQQPYKNVVINIIIIKISIIT